VIDLKSQAGVNAVIGLSARADALIEGFRPGVMERLGLGPEILLERNPRLVYARITGWGQTGSNAHIAGHDPNYIAMTGAVHAMGPPDSPVLPLNIVGDYGGGGMFLAFGLMSALWHARATGEGQVIDVAIVDGVLSMMTALYGSLAAGAFSGERTGAGAYAAGPFNGVYMCADGKAITLCAFEPPFYRALLEALGMADDPDLKQQFDRARWPAGKAKLKAQFAREPQSYWIALLGDIDACFAPVISMREALDHPYHVERANFVEVAGTTVPAPAPRFSKTPAGAQGPPVEPGQGGAAALRDWGLADEEIGALVESRAISIEPWK
jgi:alpha-methylacyl-CoA racemase